MRLIELAYTNFKGHTQKIVMNGADVDIFGANGSGKTTNFDAFNWLLFGKDSQWADVSEDIKYKAQMDHGEEHEVSAIIETETGKRIELKRIYHETWTKKRGNAEAAFSGHTTDFFINDVPVKKKDYQEKIEEFADEEKFKLLTDPLYFKNQLHWQDRRKILIDVCGDVSDYDVITSNINLNDLARLLGDRSLDDFRKMIMAQRTKINKELDRIPVRIDEVRRGLPQESETSMAQPVLETEIESLKGQQSELRKKIVQIQNGGAVAEKKKGIAELEAKQLQIKNKYDHEINRKALEAESVIANLGQKKSTLQSSIAEYKKRSDNITACITRTGEEIVALRAKWGAVDAEQPALDVTDTCPTCRQHLPVDQINAAKAKLLETFNLNKADQLKQINDSGKKKKAQMEADASQLETISKDIRDAEAKIVAAEDEINSLKTQAENVADYTSDNEYIDAANRIKQLEVEIKNIESGSMAEIQQLNSEIRAFDTDITVRQDKLALLKRKKDGEQRIKELEAEQAELSKTYESLERQLFLTEEFIQTKVAMLDEKINSKFSIAKFNLFETQVNGGISECCTVLYNGVAKMSKSEEIKAGLDIIKTLSEHYGIKAPIFIDNCESISDIPDLDTQIIRLIVSKADQNVRIEVKNNQQAVA